MKSLELSNALKERIGYTLELSPSQICHKEVGQSLYLNGRVGVGVVVSFYPGIIYSPCDYRCIPGYPRVDIENSYLISRYDGIVIDGQPWGIGGEARELWNGISESKMIKMKGSVIERRNHLALGHFANHPEKGMEPNVMVCPYNFPLLETTMRPYIPNLLFGSEEEVIMERLSNPKRSPDWYHPVDEEEDRRRWS
eukprot:Gb_02120 [translate_table: standard]